MQTSKSKTLFQLAQALIPLGVNSLLLVLLVWSASAQDTPFRLPSESVFNFPDPKSYIPVTPANVVWLDDETLLFEAQYPFPEPGQVPAFRYHVPARALTPLEQSPLRFEPTPDEREHFQLREAAGAFQSPFLDRGLIYRVYESTLDIYCGHECVGTLIMVASVPNGSNNMIDQRYRPLDFTVQGGLQVYWASGGSAAIIENSGNYSCFSNLYHVGLRGGYADIRFDSLNCFEELLFAVSDDGLRVLYSKIDHYDMDDGTPNADWALMLWEADIHPPENPDWQPYQVLGTRTMIIRSGLPWNPVQPAFAGANFDPDDPNRLIALHHDGIIAIDRATDERIILNPDINAQWVKLGLFSPDNRYVAVYLAGGAFYVLETGIA
jgi:hypothetical protein